MPQLPSWFIAGGSRDVEAYHSARFLACLNAVLATVAVAAGDPQQSSPDSDDESAEQAGRPSSLLRDPEARKKSPPPVAGSDYESDEDCE
jgi:hypothetical protein